MDMRTGGGNRPFDGLSFFEALLRLITHLSDRRADPFHIGSIGRIEGTF
jgi:hypothetical protein